MDDVQYLKKHAAEESYLFLCDSQLRDPNVFPTPSEYEVQFNSPFKNVFSVDLIDATVPRTEYIIEQGRNTVMYALSHPASVSTQPANVVTATVAPGDYNLPQLVEALNAAFEASAPGAVSVSAAPTTVPSEISNKLSFTCAVPFTFMMASSGLRAALGFGNPVNTADMTDGFGRAQYTSAPGWSSTDIAGADMFLSVPQDPVAERVLEGPVPIDAAEPVYAGRAVRQYFTPTATGNVAAVDVFAAAGGDADETWGLAVSVHHSGNGAVVAQPTAASFEYTVENGVGGKWSASWATAAAVQVGSEYYVHIQSDAGDAQNHLAVFRARSNFPSGSGVGSVRAVVDGTETPIPETDEDLCVDVYAATAAHALTSPGLVNLTGERYVLVRCPEIEQHLYRERAYERYHAGLGMVKLSGYGYRDQRYDFVSFPPRRFHPIGKLSKLTIRLERADGTLYNAHGIEHSLTLVIRYYAQAELPGAPSVLNPHYTPQLHVHLAEDRWAREDEENFNRRWR